MIDYPKERKFATEEELQELTKKHQEYVKKLLKEKEK
jgi:uncharacterized membrane-anchored protein